MAENFQNQIYNFLLAPNVVSLTTSQSPFSKINLVMSLKELGAKMN
jgi:hypothetical protein